MNISTAKAAINNANSNAFILIQGTYVQFQNDISTKFFVSDTSGNIAINDTIFETLNISMPSTNSYLFHLTKCFFILSNFTFQYKLYFL